MSAPASATNDPAPAESGRLTPLTFAAVLAIAGPVALSNATVPLQGAVDTGVIGNLGDVAALAAVGLGAEIFGLLFGSLNFLQIGLSGLTAQALGRGDARRVVDGLWRGFLVAAALAALLILLQGPLGRAGLALFEASEEAESLTAAYFSVRIWGAPAELGNYALLGWFAGQAMTRRLFQHQLVVSCSNIALSLLFVIGFGWGVPGVAAATALANYLGLAYGLWMASARMRALLAGALAGAGPTAARRLPTRAALFDRAAHTRLLALNRDLFIRTMLLVGAFAWMARLGSQQGDAILAVNVVLFQFFLVSAYALDGFAIAAETLVGQAVGARSRRRLDAAFRLTFLGIGAMSLAVSLLFVLVSGPVIDLFASAPEVRSLAREYALWAALIPAVGFMAFHLDGVFVGATGGPQMRNSMIAASIVYFPLSLALMDAYGNHGIWAALWIWLLIRAAGLGLLYPALRRRATPDGDTALR